MTDYRRYRHVYDRTVEHDTRLDVETGQMEAYSPDGSYLGHFDTDFYDRYYKPVEEAKNAE
jgi:hypothetical protein